MKNTIILTVLILLWGCASSAKVKVASDLIANESVAKPCSYDQVSGREFNFRKLQDDLTEYGYQFWKESEDSRSKNIAFNDFVGKKAKFLEPRYNDWGSVTSYPAITEDCRTLYLFPQGASSLKRVEYWSEIYFSDTFNGYRSDIGKTVWVRKSEGRGGAFLKDRNNGMVAFKNYEKIEITGLDTTFYDFMPPSPLYYLGVTSSGSEVLLALSSSNYVFQNPFASDWSTSVIEAIKNKRVFIGMNREQVVLSWGEPTNKNLTVTGKGTKEQWVYGIGDYLYFRNGVLEALQSHGK